MEARPNAVIAMFNPACVVEPRFSAPMSGSKQVSGLDQAFSFGPGRLSGTKPAG
jgi:hypothetical protein